MGKRVLDFLLRLRGDGKDPARARLLAILGIARSLAITSDRRARLQQVLTIAYCRCQPATLRC